MDKTIFSGINYSQHLGTCVLASYAVACFPFTGTSVLSYFVAYCRHFNKLKGACAKLDESNPERSYEWHFHDLASQPGNSGYKILKSLHDGSDEPEFLKARTLITLNPVDWSKTDAAAVDLSLQKADCLLLLFINASNFVGLTMHSIVLGHDGQHLYYFDTAPGALVCYRHSMRKVADFGSSGDAYLVTKKAVIPVLDAPTEHAGSLYPSAPEHGFPTSN